MDIGRAASIGAAGAGIAGLWLLHQTSLYTLYFVTGWLLLGTIVLDLYWRWQQSAMLPSASRWIGVHAGIALSIAGLFLLHLEFRVPNGWIEGALLLLFIGLLISGLAGLAIRLAIHLGWIDARSLGPALARRWVLVHVPLEASIVALASVHAVLVHGHGFMAHVMLGR